MRRNEFWRIVLLRTLGNFLVLFALYGVVATFGPALYYELQFQVIKYRGIHFTVENSANPSTSIVTTQHKNESTAPSQSIPSFATLLTGKREQLLPAKDPDFSISIAKIGASAKIFPNVDPSNPDVFLPVLKQGIAHAKGSVFPGMQGNIYLFAHSTDNWWDVGRYNAIFYLLKDLSKGDSIVIFFENHRYDYEVSQIQITDPNDVSLLIHDQTGDEQLILQTCWPPGTTWKRLYVIAKPKVSL